SASYQYLDEDDNRKFAIYNRNIDEGFNYGLEAEADWSVNNDWRLLASLGLLQSGLNEYEYTDKYSEITYLIEEGRDQAHAPNYQFSIGAEYFVNTNWVVAANLEGKDAFYFSDSHNETSSAYSLVNASVEYNRKNWTVLLWTRNLLDKEYDVRGFHFGNDPSLEYTPTTYTQKGEPRTIGLTARYDF
ncbi:MAG: TonB-dependent receptor, partial [Pseudomonadota bacterium]|nr:TonB-dependent receptor [Pseudomonadota bacterium]